MIPNLNEVLEQHQRDVQFLKSVKVGVNEDGYTYFFREDPYMLFGIDFLKGIVDKAGSHHLPSSSDRDWETGITIFINTYYDRL